MVAQLIGAAADPTALFPPACVAKALGPQQRKELSIQALAGHVPVSQLATGQQVSRQFIYRQAGRAAEALDEAFAPADGVGGVLFHLPVTKAWLEQLVLAQVFIRHTSHRGVGEIFEAVFGQPGPSVGTVHNILAEVLPRARAINAAMDLGGIAVGAHDEIYQARRPVRVGADVQFTYCYLLAELARCDETTWGAHLLELAERGLHPDYTVADGGLALRAGQKAAWGSIPCHGDVFHGERELTQLASYLSHRAAGCTAAVATLEHKMERLKKSGRDGRTLSGRLNSARRARAQAVALAEDAALLLPSPTTGR